MAKNNVSEFVRNVSDEDLKFITGRLSDRQGNDFAEALNLLSKNKQMDNYLGSAQSAMDLFDKCDYILKLSLSECKKRNLRSKK